MKQLQVVQGKQNGFAHHLVLPVLVVIAVAAIGVRALTTSHAATPNYGNIGTAENDIYGVKYTVGACKSAITNKTGPVYKIQTIATISPISSSYYQRTPSQTLIASHSGVATLTTLDNNSYTLTTLINTWFNNQTATSTFSISQKNIYHLWWQGLYNPEGIVTRNGNNGTVNIKMGLDPVSLNNC